MLYDLFQTLKVVLIHLVLRFWDHHHNRGLTAAGCIVGLLLVTALDDHFMLIIESVLTLHGELESPDQLRNLLNISSLEVFSHCLKGHSIDLG